MWVRLLSSLYTLLLHKGKSPPAEVENKSSDDMTELVADTGIADTLPTVPIKFGVQ